MDQLDSLLKEALAHELNKKRGAGSVKRVDEIKAICHALYTNPDNWTATRTIALIHLESGETLGIFQEYVHKKSSARKLERIASDAIAQDSETVSGPEWVGPYQHVVDPPTEGELAHIRNAWKPKMWRPAWLHKKRQPRTVTQMLEELSATT